MSGREWDYPVQPTPVQWQKLGDLLLEAGLIEQSQLDSALEYQREQGVPLGHALVYMGVVTHSQILSALAFQAEVLAWDLTTQQPDPEALASVNSHFCRDEQVLPVMVYDDRLVVAMKNPTDVDLIDRVARETGMRIEPALADEIHLSEQIENCYFRGSKSQQNRINELVLNSEMMRDQIDVDLEVSNLDQAEIDETKPVIGLVNKIIYDAIFSGASDIHLEPGDDEMRIRYRIDGRLRTTSRIPLNFVKPISSRIKLMAELDPVEWRIPQDGRILVKYNNRPIDLRISVLPSSHGSRVAMRILDQSVGLMSIDELGFSDANKELFSELVKLPFGLFLVSGPTGCGKTTTLYSALQDINDPEINIMTCEDPIEYSLSDISQSQSNPKVGLTFTTQLRSVLRQDPDVLLIGEIRDVETAETAIRAAITGHFVLSTVHANNAVHVVTRLADMGIDRALLAAATKGAMAQRLVRKLCTGCISEAKPTASEKELLSRVTDEKIKKVYRSSGCQVCEGTGFRGRVALQEIMPFSDEMGVMITQGAAPSELIQAARELGFKTMAEDAVWRILSGQTSVAEAARVVSFRQGDHGFTQVAA